jgi:ABC-2 type transport system ATP-binding protein
MAPRVVVRDLRKSYGSFEAARGVSFEVEEGEIFGLIGPNGAGKTTTMECVIGLREPDAGEIEVCGLDARRQPAGVKERIGAALQTTSLQDRITPREALDLFGSFYRHPEESRRLLERFSLAAKADVPFDTLSGGQRQRLALALAFVNRPEVVFLDEPTTGLDPQSRRELHGEIARMREEGHTVLLTTHAIDEAERLCDRIAIIDHGRVIASGAPRELIARSNVTPAVTLETTEPLDPELLAGLPGAREVTCDGGVARFRTPTVARTLAELMRRLAERGVEPAGLRVAEATLEDVFFELTGTSLRE